MPEVGVKGQEKLAESKVLCIGAGGLGSPLALYLASAGIGTIGIVDFDVLTCLMNIHPIIALDESKLFNINSHFIVDVFDDLFG